MSKRCVFLNMPFTGLVRPSPALGVLQALLKHSGIETETIYADLLFAGKAGLENLTAVGRIPPHELFGDWVFAPGAFIDHHRDDREYLELVYRRNRPHITMLPEEFIEYAFRLREFGMSFLEELSEIVAGDAPAIVGCSSTLQQHVASLAILRMIRERNPGTVTLLGGANCESVMGLTAHRCFHWIDYLVSGEADQLIVPLVEGILLKGSHIPAEEIPFGVMAPVHRKTGYPKPIERAVLLYMEDQPLPDYTDYFRMLKEMPVLAERIKPSIPLETSRGCWHTHAAGGCTFCSLNGEAGSFRTMSPGKAASYIKEAGETYTAGRMQMMDNVLPREYPGQMLPLLDGEEGPNLWYEVRTGLDPGELHSLHSAGVKWIWAGIESLHDDLLKLMNKGSTACRNIRFLRDCRKTGIFTGWNIITDFPGDEDRWYREMAELIPLLYHLQPPRALMRLRFDRFSRYHGYPGMYGLQLTPSLLYRYIYPVAEEDLADLAYFFEDDERQKNPAFSALLHRPGIRALTEAAALWSKKFYSPDVPVLTMEPEGDGAVITDTRSGSSVYTIEAPVYSALRAFERGGNAKAAEVIMTCEGFTSMDAEEALNSLRELQLVATAGGRTVSLPITGNAVPLPGPREYPGGYICRE